MSNVKAYKCDLCKVIKEENEMTGLILTGSLFGQEFRSTHLLHRAETHYCMSCYREKVLKYLEAINRKKAEQYYQDKMKELTAVFHRLVWGAKKLS